MLLAIDIGNTNTVFALFDIENKKGETPAHVWRCVTSSGHSTNEYTAFLRPLFAQEGLEWESVSSVIIASVVPEVDFQIKTFSHDVLGCDPLFVMHDLLDISVNMDVPGEVGADRLVNAVAVLEYYQAPAIVIDFGTATTFDVIDERGAYAGGAIAPGINLSIEALGRAAAKLPQVSIEKPDRAIGKNTVEAIYSGIFWGYVGLIEGLLKQIKNEMSGQTPLVLATGGLAPLFAEHVDEIKVIDGDLTIKGLLKIYKAKL